MNYLPFDADGTAPTVELDSADISDQDPAATGIQVLEGSSIAINPSITDDVQVRMVELLVDGETVQTDFTIPFELNAIMPLLTAEIDTARVQVRAFDTGGNVGSSPTSRLNLSRTRTPR